MTDTGTKDALGNEIIIGDLYGYSVDSNGYTTSTVGKTLKFTESGKVTLETISCRGGIWLHEAEEVSTSKKVSVKPAKLFPVNPENLK